MGQGGTVASEMKLVPSGGAVGGRCRRPELSLWAPLHWWVGVGDCSAPPGQGLVVGLGSAALVC